MKLLCAEEGLGGDGFVEDFLEGIFLGDADELLGDFAVLEEHDGWD